MAAANQEFAEPEGEEVAGVMRITPIATSYEKFMAGEGIPVYTGPGFRDVRDLELSDWSRVGGKGAFLVPDNTVDVLGMQVIQIPAGGSLEPQRGMFETKVYVVEGEGTAELWLPGSDAVRRFEWAAGALFAIPMNTTYRLVNGSRKPVLLIVG